MKLEKYLRLDPSGELSWITIDRDHFLEGFYEAIGCTCVEHVLLKSPFECIVDESGWYSEHQYVNLYASRLYPGFSRGIPLIGPVVFVRTAIDEDGDPDLFPLASYQLPFLERALGIAIPVEEVDHG